MRNIKVTPFWEELVIINQKGVFLAPKGVVLITETI